MNTVSRDSLCQYLCHCAYPVESTIFASKGQGIMMGRFPRANFCGRLPSRSANACAWKDAEINPIFELSLLIVSVQYFPYLVLLVLIGSVLDLILPDRLQRGRSGDLF